jgi:hypothetical protein
MKKILKNVKVVRIVLCCASMSVFIQGVEKSDKEVC